MNGEIWSPYRTYMTKVAEASKQDNLPRELATDIGLSILASRGLGGGSILGSTAANAADYLAARYLVHKALDRIAPEPASQASL